MPRDSCAIPPGREWAVANLLPEVPGPIWDRWVADGAFPQGIQKGLDETFNCHVNVDVYVKRGPTSTPIRGVNIRGFFPWGWYRVSEIPPEERPPDPAETVRWVREMVPPAERAPLSPRAPALSGWALSEAECVVPVPTIDFLIPYPFHPMPRYTIDAAGTLVDVPAGGFGRLWWRLPGSDHPLFSSGLGVEIWRPEELSDLGRAVAAHRASQGVNIFGSWPIAMFDVANAGLTWQSANDVVPYWWTRDFSASHMQCLSPLRYSPGVPAEWRWREGGVKPKPYVGRGFDVFEVRSAHGARPWQNHVLQLKSCAMLDDGTRMLSLAPESPFGPGEFHGPEPGTFS